MGEGEVAVKGATKLRPLAKAPGAQFEVSIDGTHSAIVVRDLQSGEATAVEYKPDLGPR